MFTIFKKRMLVNAIQNASINNLHIYKEGILDLCKMADMPNISDEDIQKKSMQVRKTYLDSINSSMIETLKLSSPNISTNVEYLYSFMNNNPEGVMGGRILDLLLEQLTGKHADGETMIKLNHYQNDLMTKVMHEVDDEIF